MARSIELGPDTAAAINELGGTFDSPNDVIRRLIREAGHQELLDQANQREENDEMKQATELGANERKEQFLNHLLDHAKVEDVEKVRRSVWQVETEGRTVYVWIHFHRDFEFFGGSWNVNSKYSKRGYLVHVFLGPEEQDYYVVPDGDLHSGRFTVYNTEDDAQWKMSTERGTPPNKELLERDYSSLDPILS
jgi:Arc/MetJ-type ribon-helix-helix transcriptional regulator